MNKTFIQFLKFGVVGVVNTLVDLLVLTIAIWFVPAGRSGDLYKLFKGISFLAANLNSYTLNRLWTFRQESGQKSVTREFSQYLIVSIIGLIINVSVSSFVVDNIVAPEALTKFWPQVAALGGTAVGLVWNFLGYKIVVFSKKTGI